MAQKMEDGCTIGKIFIKYYPEISKLYILCEKVTFKKWMQFLFNFKNVGQNFDFNLSLVRLLPDKTFAYLMFILVKQNYAVPNIKVFYSSPKKTQQLSYV